MVFLETRGVMFVLRGFMQGWVKLHVALVVLTHTVVEKQKDALNVLVAGKHMEGLDGQTVPQILRPLCQQLACLLQLKWTL